MNISPEAREAAQVLTNYLAIRGFKDGQAAIAMQTLIDQTIERCAAKCEQNKLLAMFDGSNAPIMTAARNARNAALNRAADDIRSLKSNTDGGGDE